jgi:hypothetical protein
VEEHNTTAMSNPSPRPPDTEQLVAGDTPPAVTNLSADGDPNPSSDAERGGQPLGESTNKSASNPVRFDTGLFE